MGDTIEVIDGLDSDSTTYTIVLADGIPTGFDDATYFAEI